MSPPREKISHRICTINPLPVQQEQSTEEQPSFQTSLDCRGQTPVPPPKGRNLQLSAKAPVPAMPPIYAPSPPAAQLSPC